MNNYSLVELKLIYRALHAGLGQFPEMLDSEFLLNLQNHLQAEAQKAEVDLSDHAAWDSWLGQKSQSCQVRLKNRKVWN